MLSLVHLIYMAGDKCMRQNACFIIIRQRIFLISIHEPFYKNIIHNYSAGDMSHLPCNWDYGLKESIIHQIEFFWKQV